MAESEEMGFFTQKGYALRSHRQITGAMEDYLEMICRQAREAGYARIGMLAEHLNVRPSSASKMVRQLRELGLVEFPSYGLIRPTAEGFELGNYLLRRHNVLFRFFCLLNGTDDELEQVEQVEHFIRPETVDNLEALTERLVQHETIAPQI